MSKQQLWATVIYATDQDCPSPAESTLLKTTEDTVDDILKKEWLRYFGESESDPDSQEWRKRQAQNLVVAPYTGGRQDPESPVLVVSCQWEDYSDCFVFATPVS
jgi:hypothetical protein